MREIKFRGLRTDGGEWIYGHYLVVNDRHIIVPAKVNIRFNCDFILPENLGYGFGELERCGDGFPVEVIPETVWQYTGLKDLNGVEIYDGDIITLSYGIPSTTDTLVIEWVDDQYVNDCSVSGWWMLNLRKNGCSASLHKTYEGDIEVIGNIHQNSELLGEGES